MSGSWVEHGVFLYIHFAMCRFKFIDLFAGIGGFHHALKRLGGECVMVCEIDPECRKVYLRSFPEIQSCSFVDNIRRITRLAVDDENSLRSPREIDRLVPDHDLLCAGFPCQPFSKSGFQQGVRDKTRGTLFFDILQIVEAKCPPYVLLENVRNLAGPRHLSTWRTIIESLDEVGYSVLEDPLVFSPHLMPPDWGGTPQIRERILIPAVRKGLSTKGLHHLASLARLLREKVFWDPDKWRISDYLLPEKSIPEIDSFIVSRHEATYLEAWDFFVSNIPEDSLPSFPIWIFAPDVRIKESMPDWEQRILKRNLEFYNRHKPFIDWWCRMRWGREGMTVRDFPLSRQKFEWQAAKAHPTRKGRTLKNLVIQFRPSGIRVKPPTYLPALVAITQTSVIGPLVHKGGHYYRRITPVEAARLQGFPDSVYDGSPVENQVAYHQLGNAVNTGVVSVVASVLMGLDFPLSKHIVAELEGPLFSAI